MKVKKLIPTKAEASAIPRARLERIVSFEDRRLFAAFTKYRKSWESAEAPRKRFNAAEERLAALKLPYGSGEYKAAEKTLVAARKRAWDTALDSACGCLAEFMRARAMTAAGVLLKHSVAQIDEDGIDEFYHGHRRIVVADEVMRDLVAIVNAQTRGPRADRRAA